MCCTVPAAPVPGHPEGRGGRVRHHCAVCCAVCRSSSCHVRVPHTVVYLVVYRTEIQSMSGLVCVRLCLPCYPCVQLLTWFPAVFDRGHTNFPKTRPTQVPEDISQACRGLPSRRHLKSVPLGVAQARKVCYGPAPYPRGRQAMQSSIATQVSVMQPTCQEETDP